MNFSQSLQWQMDSILSIYKSIYIPISVESLNLLPVGKLGCGLSATPFGGYSMSFYVDHASYAWFPIFIAE